jgi:pimeloyl-ACP methyl ester carboxylesterase
MTPRHLPGGAPRRLRRGPLATAALLALALLLAATAAARPTAPVRRADAARPTIVLVHGAWADGSSWGPVARRLQNDGYTVDVPPNPLRGISYDAAVIADYLSTINGPIVLVGHSYGGAVITNAAFGNPNVKALVYVDAFIPKRGQSVIQLATVRPGSHLGGDPRTVFSFVPYPGAPAGDVDLYVKPSVFIGAFANDLPQREGLLLAASQRPLTLSGANEPSGPPATRTIPSWAVVGTIDLVIPPVEQRVMARQAGAQIVQIHAGHLSMLSRPKAVEHVITEAAAAVS